MNPPESSGLLAVSVIGRDRTGIVADVTSLLYEHGCNLEDVTSTILGGHFAMLMLVQAPADIATGALESAFRATHATEDLDVTVRAVEAGEDRVTPPSHMVSVYGADRPGIVMNVARAVAGAGAGITDLTSRVIGSDAEPVYALMLEVAAPDPASLEAELDRVRDDLGIDVSVHLLEVDVL